jgi:hypothetical protein
VDYTAGVLTGVGFISCFAAHASTIRLRNANDRARSMNRERRLSTVD